MKKTLKQVSGLFVHSTWYLFFLEIIYKGFGALVVFPLCEMLLHLALRFSGVHYISRQNLKAAMTNPLILSVFVVILLIFILFQGFELSCLAVSYQQTYYRRRITLFQLLKEGIRKTFGFLHPRNWLLLPILLILIPSLIYFIQNSSNNYISLFTTLFKSFFSSFVTTSAVVAFLVVLFFFSIFGMLTLHIHFAEGKGGFSSIRSAFRTFRTHFFMILAGILLWSLLVGVILLLFNLGVYLLIRIIVRAVVSAEVARAVTLTWMSYARVVLNFINFSVLSFAGYAFLASFYYQNEDPEREKAEQTLQKMKDPKARLHGLVAIAASAVAILLTVGVNILLLYTARKDAMGGFLSAGGIAIISHRGVIDDYAENTLGALQAGIDAQADFIEFDVQLTQDGEVALLHDKTMKRCWGIDKHLRDYYAVELLFIKDAQEQHPPTLREVFDMCKDQNIQMLIELKVNAYSHAEELATAVMNVIEEYDLADRCVIQSFSYKSLQTVKRMNPDVVCGYLMNEAIGTPSDLECADFFSFNLNYVTKNTVDNIHLRNKKLIVWTVNIPSRFDKAIELDVDGIITDRPIEAREWIYQDTILETILPEEDAAVTEP